MRYVFIIFAVFFVGFLAACRPEEASTLAVTDELIVLTRSGTMSYSKEKQNHAAGFDHELVQAFAKHLKLKPRFIVAHSDADLLRRLKKGDAHLAAAWQVPVDNPSIQSSDSYFTSRNLLVSDENMPPFSSLAELAHETVHVLLGSRQESVLRKIKETHPSLRIETHQKQSEIDLLESVAQGRIDLALVSNVDYQLAKNYYPELREAFNMGIDRPIVWLFGAATPTDLIDKANLFLSEFEKNGEMARLKDKYLGHINRLTSGDILRFLEDINTVLPRYRAFFWRAEINTGIDWRILAALAYQESKWNPLATSPTGVRGMMMLTGETADRLGVTNRLDPEESIRAGARYLNNLRDMLPQGVQEPDRLWLALAAYNLGFGHLNAGRYIASTLGVNSNSWYEMKKVLPLLARPEYYRRLKSGKGRGGEAVILTENIRMYADILYRFEPAYDPLTRKGTGGKSPSLQPVPAVSLPNNQSQQLR